MKKTDKRFIRRIFTMIIILVMIAGSMDVPVSVHAAGGVQGSTSSIIKQMTLDEKISQLIIPAIRTWKADDSSASKNVTVLSEFPQLEKALRRHQYGGVILYASNVKDSEQVVRLTTDLQKNNAQIAATTNIPYFMPVDEEGGIVLRIGTGTRMTGNMAIGATGKEAKENAFLTGRILGKESAAAGFNVDFAPDADVNNNPANPVIGTRSFSDDPDTVATLAVSYARGLKDNGIIGCYKHFPGHGDTGTDSHVGLPSVDKSYDELKKTELVPFRNAISQGAEMIMTAHITFPRIDDKVTFPDGSEGYYPATMSKKIIQEILRGDMGYKGLVVTDALEMGAIGNRQLVPGEIGSVEYCANVAEYVINAGVDILLLPLDMTGPAAVTFYDQYIEMLVAKVKSGSITEARIDESLRRIINLKRKSGILSIDTSGEDVEEAVDHARAVIGCNEHHRTEMEIARQAVTLVRNEESALPLAGFDKKIVFLCRNDSDNVTIMRSVRGLQEKGILDPKARIVNRVTGDASGDEKASTWITIDCYQDGQYTDVMQSDIYSADVVVGLSKNSGLSGLQATNWQYQGIKKAMDDIHSKGGKFILISDNLPYDSARFQESEGILLAYMGSGLGTDPTDSEDGAYSGGAYNANVEAAVQTVFGDNKPSGRLPVMIPAIGIDGEGKVFYTDQVLYARGFGMDYKDQSSEGSGDKPDADKDNKDPENNTGQSGDDTKKTVKKANTLIAKGKTVKIKYSSIKKKAKTINRKKIITLKKAEGKVSYKKISVNKKKYAGRFKINKSTGKLTVKPGVKKGTYKIRVKVTAAGNSQYKSGSKKVNVVVKVR